MTLLALIFGHPMAAPETRPMRRLRWTFIGSAAASALGVAGIDVGIALCGPVIAGGALLTLLCFAGVSGSLFVFKKHRIDDAWLLARGCDQEGEGA